MRHLSRAWRAGPRAPCHGGLPRAPRETGLIGRLTGKLLARHPPQIVIEVQGVGYELDVPMSTLYQLPASGNDVTLYTHLIVREDAHQLYGFGTESERPAFRQLFKI